LNDMVMDTYFASPDRSTDKELAAEIKTVGSNPVISALLQSISGLLAIVDRNRQIIAVNDSLLNMLGLDDPQQVLGLRPGEVLQCVHAHDDPAGCGTTEYCSTCGAAIAMVASIEKGIPAERLCALSAERKGRMIDMALLIRAQPIEVDSTRFILLFVKDVTRQQQRAALERTFYHDINNVLGMLVQASELLVAENTTALASTIHQAAFRLLREVAIQHSLTESSAGSYQPMWAEFTTQQIFKELKSFFANHPAANDINVEFVENHAAITIKTDISLLLRVLCNMIINALEATDREGLVKIWPEYNGETLNFCVWNASLVPPDIANRIFQRNFSTKAQAGRGIGTYSMKLFGEKILGGKVDFISSAKDGTIFRFTHHLA